MVTVDNTSRFREELCRDFHRRSLNRVEEHGWEVARCADGVERDQLDSDLTVHVTAMKDSSCTSD